MSDIISYRNNTLIDNLGNTQSVIVDRGMHRASNTQRARSNTIESEGDGMIDLTVDVQLLDGTKVNPEDAFVTGIDPGVVNCSMCVWDVLHERPHSFEKIAFRPSGDKRSDIGNGILLGGVKTYLNENGDRLFSTHKDLKFQNVFIEDQAESMVNEINESKYGNSFTANKSREVISVQYGIQYHLGNERCLAVSAMSVKSHFGEYFPRLEVGDEVLTKTQVRSKQYRIDKKNSILNGRLFVPDYMQNAIKSQGKEDDYYDAMWIAKYAAEKYFKRVNKKTGKEIFSGGINKRRKGKNTGRVIRKRLTKKKKEEFILDDDVNV